MSICCNRWRAVDDAAVKMMFRGGAGASSNSTKNGIDDTPGQFLSEGVPRAAHILESWSISVSPGRNALRSSSSAKVHPTDHMSMGCTFAELLQIGRAHV